MSVNTHFEPEFQVKREKDACIKVEHKRCQVLIGSPVYLTFKTHADTIYSSYKLSQPNTSPHSQRMIGGKDILRYVFTQDFQPRFKRRGSQPVYG